MYLGEKLDGVNCYMEGRLKEDKLHKTGLVYTVFKNQGWKYKSFPGGKSRKGVLTTVRAFCCVFLH